jgi:hypothetical protein
VTGLADSGFFLNYDWTTKKPGSGAPGSAAFPSNAVRRASARARKAPQSGRV